MLGPRGSWKTLASGYRLSHCARNKQPWNPWPLVVVSESRHTQLALVYSLGHSALTITVSMIHVSRYDTWYKKYDISGIMIHILKYQISVFRKKSISIGVINSIIPNTAGTAITLSSWHTLLKCSLVNNQTPAFLRGCLLPLPSSTITTTATSWPLRYTGQSVSAGTPS